MPLYDYQCPDCKTTFEARHGFNDLAPTCPTCGGANAHRIITHAPGVMQGMAASLGKSASKEQLQSKWAEETPRLREKLVSKLGEDTVNKHAPTLNTKYE